MDNSSNNQQEITKIFCQLQEEYDNEISQLKQKARIKWDSEGDKNSRFFHMAIQKRRCINQINRISWRDSIINDPENIRKALFQGFKEFYYSKIEVTPFNLSSLNWYTVSPNASENLEREFNKEKIWLALKESDPNKAPGPDGLNAGWLLQMWPLMSNEILEFFREFHRRSYLPQVANSLFFALIPKTHNPVNFSDFRPISPINSSAKLLLKVLANRLKPICW